MKRNKTPTGKVYAEKIFNSFVWFKDEKIYLSQEVPSIIALFLLFIMSREVKIIYDMADRTCPCGGKLHKHEIKLWKMNKIFPIYKQRYKCCECGKTLTTPLNGIVERHCNYTTYIMDLILNIDSIEHTSYKNKAKLLQKQWKLKIHRSTVYLHKKNKYSQYSQAKWKCILNLLNKTKLEYSGV